jgi:DNA-binding XRE family transcriptional regulator
VSIIVDFDAVKPSNVSGGDDPKPFVDLTAGLGAALRRMRKLKGMNQAEIAEKVSLERTSIVNIEAGKQKLSVLTLCGIADALGVDVHITFSDKVMP